MTRVSFCGPAFMRRWLTLFKEWYFRKRKEWGLSMVDPMDKTGTWAYRDGRMVKISDEVPKLKVIQDWQKQCNPKLDAEAYAKRYGEKW